jgi:hypothetical protein
MVAPLDVAPAGRQINFPLGRRPLQGLVEPFPIVPVALQLPLVGLAALGRAELLEAPAVPDQSEGTRALGIAATVGHDAASAFARRIRRMKFS